MQNSCTPLKGEYSENLSHGGKLKVTITSWHIYYYFPGPDGRYSGTSVIIYDKEIDLFISAWKNNFNKYKTLIRKQNPYERYFLSFKTFVNYFL